MSFFNEWSVCCSLLQCVTDYLPDPDSQKLQCRYQQNGWESLIPIAACDQSEFPCNFSHWNTVKKNTVQNISSLLSQFLHNQFCNQEVKCFKPLPAFYLIHSLVVWSLASWLHSVHITQLDVPQAKSHQGSDNLRYLFTYWKLLICNHLDIILFQLTLAEVMVIIASKSNRVALIDCRKKQVRLS